jgi:hypothetical protein
MSQAEGACEEQAPFFIMNWHKNPIACHVRGECGAFRRSK